MEELALVGVAVPGRCTSGDCCTQFFGMSALHSMNAKETAGGLVNQSCWRHGRAVGLTETETHWQLALGVSAWRRMAQGQMAGGRIFKVTSMMITYAYFFSNCWRTHRTMELGLRGCQLSEF